MTNKMKKKTYDPCSSFEIFVAAVEVGQSIVFNWFVMDISLKCGNIELILPTKQARFRLNKSHFILKCS